MQEPTRFPVCTSAGAFLSMKNIKIQPMLFVARFFGYSLLIVGFFWLFIVIPMFCHVVSRRVMEQSDVRLAHRTENTFTLRDMESESHTSINDAFARYPGNTIPTFLMVAGGMILAYSPRSGARSAEG